MNEKSKKKLFKPKNCLIKTFCKWWSEIWDNYNQLNNYLLTYNNLYAVNEFAFITVKNLDPMHMIICLLAGCQDWCQFDYDRMLPQIHAWTNKTASCQLVGFAQKRDPWHQIECKWWCD